MTRDRSVDLRGLIFGWLSEEPDYLDTDDPTDVLRLLAMIREANGVLDAWTDKLVRVAHEHGTDNPTIGAALGVGKEAIRRRLLK